uniref:La ribonucleoprotein 7, transcriptional regulator n=1 Tax=Lepisosteus oculatus TaxID=7918 RepID=W5N0V9_LEPOC
MIDTESKQAGSDSIKGDCSEKKKEKEKKKRSRVKQLLSDVKKQVEFWFGDVNLYKDKFLRELLEKSRDGYIDISVLTSFNRMKKLTTDVKLIARALKNSPVVEVNLEGTQIRRQHPLGEDPKNVDQRTVYVIRQPLWLCDKHASSAFTSKLFGKWCYMVFQKLVHQMNKTFEMGFTFIIFYYHFNESLPPLNHYTTPKKASLFEMSLSTALTAELIRTVIRFVLFPPVHVEEKKKKKRKKSRSSRKDNTAQPPAASKETKPDVKAEPADKKKRHRGASESETDGAEVQKTSDKKKRHRGARSRKPPKTLGKREKKRRRSHNAEASGLDNLDEMPCKIRKVCEVEEASQVKTEPEIADKDMKDLSAETEKGEKKDDSLLKAKRKRKKKHKERHKMGEEVIPLRVLSKEDWLELKQEYITLQKSSMASLKKLMNQIKEKADGDMDVESSHSKQDGDKNSKDNPGSKKDSPLGPQFVSGVIVKITHSEPLPGRKCIKDALSEISAVVYVDTLEGDAEGHVRFKTPEDAKAVIAAQSAIQKKHNWKLEILSGDREQRYWQKILVDRQAKLNRPRDKKRGTEKLIAKAEKIIKSRAKESSKHIHFAED